MPLSCQVGTLQEQLAETRAKLGPLTAELASVKTAAAQLRTQSEGQVSAAKRNVEEMQKQLQVRTWQIRKAPDGWLH